MRKRIKRIVKITGVSLCAIVLVVVAAAAGSRIHGQHEAALALTIQTPSGIVEAGFQSIGGIEQWIQIRGENRDNPVLLFLHGGPSVSMLPFTYRSMRVWEKQFTIVHWDQRGAGRTYTRNGGAVSAATGIDQLVADGLDVAEFARQRLQKRKIILVGESFGTVIGTEMARRRPDLFYAYVGTGQIVNMAKTQTVGYRLLKERIHAAGDVKTMA
ncbi:MAG: alpha/beta fold hydrolase, partial [Bryobacteraceae bacterium]